MLLQYSSVLENFDLKRSSTVHVYSPVSSYHILKSNFDNFSIIELEMTHQAGHSVIQVL